MIQTFVFLDLETTGLINIKDMPRITEMSLIALSRSAMSDGAQKLPRVLHKLVLGINPNKYIPEKVRFITKLSNDNLKEAQPFEIETYTLIVSFMNRLTKPICFVAYNGNAFDYPILLHEFGRINKAFDEDILSIDMYHLVKDFYAKDRNSMRQENIAQDIPLTSAQGGNFSNLLNDGCDEIVSSALDSMAHCDINISSPKKFKGVSTKQSDSEFAKLQLDCCRKMQEENEKTPESQIVKLHEANMKYQNKRDSNARRKLDFNTTPPENYKLSTVYEHMFNMPPSDAHSAEGDCLSMLHCANKLATFFVDWADSNAVALINNKKTV